MKFNRIWHFVFICLLAFSTLAEAGSKNEKIVFKSGKWSLQSSINPMSDEITCIGIYNDKPNIQLVDEHRLFIPIPGGVGVVTLRFDDQNPEDKRAAYNSERMTRHVIIIEEYLSKALRAKRLRGEVIPQHGSTEYFDIDLNGFSEVWKNFSAKCPSNSK